MTRRELREHLLRLLFLKEFHEADELEEQCQLYFDVILPDEGKPCDERDITLERFKSIVERLPEIDALLMARMKTWNIKRIGLIEKNILRLCAFEAKYDEDVPERVAINEAVELAKQFGGQQSAGFINGVMARIVTPKDEEVK